MATILLQPVLSWIPFVRDGFKFVVPLRLQRMVAALATLRCLAGGQVQLCHATRNMQFKGNLRMYTYRILAAALACFVAASAQAATIVGPTPYLDITDTPDGVFHDGATVCVQDFEDADGPWEIGFSIDVGQRIGPKFISGDGVPVTDSVDADDNAIDGDGTMGSSWFAPTRHLMITFDEETTAAAFAFTDADVLATSVTIQAYRADGGLLLEQSFDASFLDDVYTGTTEEDRFFGITAMGSEMIKRIRIAIDQGAGIEIDHIQFAKPVPEPATVSLLGFGLIGLISVCRRRRV